MSPASSGQLARAHKGAMARAKKHPHGHQTKKQLLSERANLSVGRANLAQDKGWKSAGRLRDQALAAEAAVMASDGVYSNTSKSSYSSSSSASRHHIRLKTTGYHKISIPNTTGYKHRKAITTTGDPRGTTSIAKQLHPIARHPLGSHVISSALYREPAKKTPTGIHHKFRPRIAAGGYLKSGIGVSRKHHFKKRLFVRKPKISRVKKWRRTKRYVTAR